MLGQYTVVPKAEAHPHIHLIVKYPLMGMRQFSQFLKIIILVNKVNISAHISSLKVGNSLKVCVFPQIYTYQIYTTYMVAALSEPFKSRPKNATKDVFLLMSGLDKSLVEYRSTAAYHAVKCFLHTI